jgi:hypothetical protein
MGLLSTIFTRRRRNLRPIAGLAFGVVAMTIQVGMASAATTDVFVRANPLIDGRWSHVAAELADGRVLVAGGWGPLGGGYITIKASAEIYDGATGTWTETGSMSAPRAGAKSAALPDGRIFVAGGESTSPAGLTTLRSIELYDPRAGTFSDAGELPFVPASATALADGRVLVTEGSGEAVLFDPTNGSIAPTGHMLVARNEAMVTRLADGRVLFAGGAYQRTAEIYDPSSGAFSPTGDLTIDRFRGSATLLADGRVLLAGGLGDWIDRGFLAEQDTVEIYDPQAGTFASSGRLARTRLSHVAGLLPSGRVLLTGGHPFTGAGALADAEVFDPTAGFSGGLIAMNHQRTAHTVTPLRDGSVLVAGGADSPQTAERFFESFTDTTAPVLTVPDEVTAVAFEPDGVIVTFDVSATDDVDPEPSVSCEPPSGSRFAIGTTAVTCTAVDRAGNVARAGFDVVVLAPLELGLVVEGRGSVQAKSGLATIRGTVSCTHPAQAYVSGELTQVVATRAVLRGFFYTELSCVPPASAWSADVVSENGRFAVGSASVSATAWACDQFSCDSADWSGPVKLKR